MRGLAAAFAALAIGALHAGAVAALLAAAAPAWRPATGERDPFGVQLIPVPAVASDRVPTVVAGGLDEAPCSETYEVDARGNLYVAGPPGPAFLRSLPAGSDGRFPLVAIACSSLMVSPWSKQAPRPSADQADWLPEPPLDTVAL